MDNNSPYEITAIQHQAITKINERFSQDINPICSLEPGRGKTVVACEIIKNFKERKMENIIVIVKKTNITDPWIKTLKMYNIPYTVIEGKERYENYTVDNTYYITKGNVLLINYEIALIDIENLYNIGIFDLVIYDEIHTIINPKKLTQKSRHFPLLQAKYQLALTATPIQNSKHDLSLVFMLLNKPKELTNMDESTEKPDNKILENMYNEAIDKKVVIICYEEGNLKKRREIILCVPLTSEMNDYINQFDIESLKNKQKIFSFLSHPDSIYKNNTIIKNTLPCTKIDAVKMILKKIPADDKIIIFSRFKDVLSCYNRTLKKEGYDGLIITGEDREMSFKRKLSSFANSNAFRILFTTLFKSSEGLNLDVANHVIILEFWWNPQKIFQAMGRIDRLTQEKNIFIYILCYNINENIIEPELIYCEIMKEKIDTAKKVIPRQKDLPNLQMFCSPVTFEKELQEFLDDFIPNYTLPDSGKIIEEKPLVMDSPKNETSELFFRDLLEIRDFYKNNENNNSGSKFDDIVFDN
jgi:superfamily II DNA or RNA helicase